MARLQSLAVIKYIGSKRKLVPQIAAVVARIPQITHAVDLFAGTTRVSQALKQSGLHVHANDMASYSEVLATCYVEADADRIDVARIEQQLVHLASLPGVDGYVTETFCERARYFQPHNGRRIDAIRAEIDQVAADRIEHAILLTSLLEAADRVDSTTGVQMAYLKQWAPRSANDLELRLPKLLPGTGVATRRDANELASTLDGIDLAYLDPPYNQHSYRGNYHVWETIVRADEPEAYGVAMKRVDVRDVKSEYNFKRRALPAFADLVAKLEHVPWLLVSFSDEGHIALHELRAAVAGPRGVGGRTVPAGGEGGARHGQHKPTRPQR